MTVTTVAFGVGPSKRRINHVMLEVDNLDDVGLTEELVREQKIPVKIKTGKHSNDHMYSFYFRNPSGWMIEYGWGGRAATHNRNITCGMSTDTSPRMGDLQSSRSGR